MKTMEGARAVIYGLIVFLDDSGRLYLTNLTANSSEFCSIMACARRLLET